MAFDFLGSIFGKKKPVKKEKAEETPLSRKRQRLESANVLGWLNTQLAREIENEREKFSSLAENLLQQIKDLRKTIENIRQKSFEAGDRTYAAVNMIKDTWAKKALMSISSYSREIRKDSISTAVIEFPVFRDLYHNTTRLMNEISMIPRQKLVLTRYFEAQSKRMSEILSSIGTLIENMKSAVTGSGTLKSINRVKELLDQLQSLAAQANSTERSIENAKSEITKKEAEIESLDQKIAGMEKSPEWHELDKLEKKMKDNLAKIEEIEFDVAEKLGSMKRVFKLFAHDASDLEKEERKVCEDMSHSPLKTFLARDAGLIGSFLKKLEHDIRNGSFRLSKKDAGKTGDLKRILESDWVSHTKREYEKTKADLDESKRKKDEINVMVDKRESERLLEKSRAELDILHRRESELEHKLKEKRSELKEKKREISDFVNKELDSELELD
jgi:predicted  nucleic acid-binding Zn-ribbon protein